MIDRLGLKENEGELILTEMIKRVKLAPFAEDSEEVRMQIIELMTKLLSINKFDFLKLISDVSITLSNLLLDSNPEMKTAASAFAS